VTKNFEVNRMTLFFKHDIRDRIILIYATELKAKVLDQRTEQRKIVQVKNSVPHFIDDKQQTLLNLYPKSFMKDNKCPNCLKLFISSEIVELNYSTIINQYEKHHFNSLLDHKKFQKKNHSKE